MLPFDERTSTASRPTALAGVGKTPQLHYEPKLSRSMDEVAAAGKSPPHAVSQSPRVFKILRSEALRLGRGVVGTECLLPAASPLDRHLREQTKLAEKFHLVEVKVVARH